MGEAVVEGLCFLESILWMRGILQVPITDSGKRRLFTVVLAAIFLFWRGIYGFGENAALIQIGVDFILLLFLFAEKPAVLFIKYLFSIFYMGILTTPVNLLVFYLRDAWKLVSNEFTARMIMETLSIGVIILASIVAGKSSFWKSTVRNIPVWYYLIGLLTGFAVAGVGAFTGFAAEEMPLAMKIFFTTIGLVTEEFVYLFGFFLLYQDELRRRYRKEIALKDELLKKVEEYYLSLERNDREVRKIRHDMKKHLGVLDYYLEREEVDKAIKYLEEMKVRLPDANIVSIEVGNKMVNAIIENEKLQMSDDITMQCTGLLCSPLDIEDFDLCVIFSNLLSNAREACGRLKESEKRIILDVGGKQGHLELTVKNPIEWEIDTKQIGRFTSKGDKKDHGLGLLNVIETVEKYSGTIYFCAENREFAVYIFI